jgi:hypothetical protein
MSLDNIQLPPQTIASLYKKTLVELKSEKIEEEKYKSRPINMLGKNGKAVLIIVNNPDTMYLPDEELNFLLNVLNACKLNMDDVSIINLDKNKEEDYKSISKGLAAERVFLFGIGTDEIKLPLSFPNYQVQQYNSQVYLMAPALSVIQADKAEKTKLWNALQQIFSI